MQIRAAVFHDETGKPSIEALELSGPAAGEVLVRIVATGVCHTDLRIAGMPGRSPRPVVLGHEGAGIVEAVGSGITDLEEGDHVVMTFASCGACPSCLDAQPAYCYVADQFACTRADGSVYLRGEEGPVHGDFFNQSSFATHAIANRRRGIVKVRKDAPLELLGPLACGIQSGAGVILNDLKMKPGQTLAVFGAGALGLSAIMAAKLTGAGRIIAVDVHQNRLRLACELGAHEVINGTEEAVSERIFASLPDGVDCAFDTSTVASVMRDAIDVLAPRGAFIFAAPPVGTGELPVPMRHMMQGRRLLGTLEGNSNPDVFIPQLIDFFMAGQFPFDRLVSFYPFDEIERAFHDSEAGTTVKPILRM